MKNLTEPQRLLLVQGLVQSVTQTIEATLHICKILDIDGKIMKFRNYWHFRNRLNHVMTEPTKRTLDLDRQLPAHAFQVPKGSVDTIRYISTGADGLEHDPSALNQGIPKPAAW